MECGTSDVPPSDQETSSNDVDTQQRETLRIECERGAGRFLDVVPVAELQRNPRRVREHVAAIRAVKAETPRERRPLARHGQSLCEPATLEPALRQVGVRTADVV